MAKHGVEILHRPTVAVCTGCQWKLRLRKNASQKAVEKFQKACFEHMGVSVKK